MQSSFARRWDGLLQQTYVTDTVMQCSFMDHSLQLTTQAILSLADGSLLSISEVHHGQCVSFHTIRSHALILLLQTATTHIRQRRLHTSISTLSSLLCQVAATLHGSMRVQTAGFRLQWVTRETILTETTLQKIWDGCLQVAQSLRSFLLSATQDGFMTDHSVVHRHRV